MTQYQYDVVVIGSGPAGDGAVMNAVKRGKRAALIERDDKLGGNCLHKGTIPSKALRYIVTQLNLINDHPLFDDWGKHYHLPFPKAMRLAQQVIHKQESYRESYYSRSGVENYTGQAAFVDEHTLEITLADGAKERLTAEHIIVATGSRPYRPPEIDFTLPGVYDSDTILELQDTPRSIIIYGAGVIGCEYASIFAGLGCQVDLVNTRERLLEFLDDEITDALSYHLRDQGVTVRHGEICASVAPGVKGVSLSLESGKRVHSEVLLYCNGRAGNTQDLNLAAIGLEPDKRGQLQVNDRYETAVPNILAAGDVIGWPSLASASYNQGRSAAASARGKEHCNYVTNLATGIYTIPEISSIGKTESELTHEQVPYEVGRAFFKNTARAQIQGHEVGMLKLLFCPDSYRILGIHCFGAESTEIIHIGQAIMGQEGKGNDIHYFLTTTFNYPTMAETYRIAALNGLNRIR